MYIYIHTIYDHICIHVSVCAHIYVSYKQMSIHTYIYTYIYIYYSCMCICVNMWICVSIYPSDEHANLFRDMYNKALSTVMRKTKRELPRSI